jgi:uncharacterized protein (TIGR03083 family)
MRSDAMISQLAPERLLAAELATLLPGLLAAPPEALARPTVCPGWAVLDVIGHCGAALGGLMAGPAYRPSHEQNRRDVLARRSWLPAAVLAEYQQGLTLAGPVIRQAGGSKDLAALGTWIHGGDVRLALGWDDAYQSEGAQDALYVLGRCHRVAQGPRVIVTLPERELLFGSPREDRPPARLTADIATVFQLFTGRPVGRERYELVGAFPDELVSTEW